MSLKWTFDPSRPSGARQGGLAAAHVIQPDIDNFVREILQNALDQREGSQAVRVSFSFHQLSGEQKDNFLAAMGWGQLQSHIEGAAVTGGVTIGPQLKQALEGIDNGPLLVMRIDDSGTRGLVGSEDSPNENFNQLCRNVLVTTEDGSTRGGSFGLGKSVLWRFSSLSTVLFSSRIDGNPQPGFRLFGRSELPFHEAEGKPWDGPGWFGVERMVGDGQKRAESAWDLEAEDAARDLQLFRPAQLGTGTSILIMGFFEPRNEIRRDVREIAGDLIESVSRWFWPSLKGTVPELKVTVEAYENGTGLYRETALIRAVEEPFHMADTSGEVKERVSEPGDVAQRDLAITIPGRRPRNGEGGDPPVEARLTLRLRLAGTETDAHRNTVAMMRGAGMVVKYRDSRKPLGEQQYHAVLKAGLARGRSIEDISLEHFLRASEPPSHNEWIPGTDRLRAEYNQGAQARLNQLWKDLDLAIIDMCEDPLPESRQGPQKLAELFPVHGGVTTAPRETFRPEGLHAQYDGERWSISGRVKCLSKQVPLWRFMVGVSLDAETGSGEGFQIEEFTVGEGATASRQGVRFQCDVDQGVKEVQFNGITGALPGEVTADDLRRTRIKIDVRARIREATP